MACGGFVVASGPASAAPPVVVSGSITGVTSGRVVILSVAGFVWRGSIASGTFQIKVGRASTKLLEDATLQVFSAQGAYVGPVVLKENYETTNPVCLTKKRASCIDDVIGLGKVSGDIRLGQLVGEDDVHSTPTWFRASKSSPIDALDAVRAVAIDG